MFTRLGMLAVRRRKRVVIISVLALAIAGFLGGAVFDRLLGGGFDDPDSESVRAAELLESEFGAGGTNIVLLVTAQQGTVDDIADEGLDLTAELASLSALADVDSYWTLGQAETLRSQDSSRALVLGRIVGDDDTRAEVAAEIIEDFTVGGSAISVAVGGEEAIFEQIGSTIESDLRTAESIALPLTLLLLLIVFGSVVAATLPLAVGITTIFGGFFVLYVVTGVTDVSIFSLNIVTALGLGLAIDYSLFVVSRFREQLEAGDSVERAVVTTVETAGRTVMFSALTVAVSLSALLIFPLYFLRSFAYAGIGVLLVAMVTSVLTLPAILAMLGHRVNTWTLWRRPRRVTGRGFWHRVAVAVMRRPAAVAATGTTALILVGLPFLGVNFGVPDDRVLPADDPARQVSDVLRSEFGSDDANGFPVVAIGDAVAASDITAFATEISRIDGVGRVDAATGTFANGELVEGAAIDGTTFQTDSGAWFNVVPTVEPISAEGERVVNDIRALSTDSFETYVGGSTAGLIDSKAAIFGLVPLAAALIALATFVLLFLMFGSILVPLKAILLNTLSLTATFGAMVWVFQQGNGADLLNFTATGLTDTSTPILMFTIAFGLSMDYEVFLLSRMKEEYDRSGDNDAAIAAGLEKTGRIVTAAALLLSVTFFAFATSGVTFIKLFGVGLGLAVLVDAFIVRATLVPALMKLAGSANWWAPAWARRIHDRFGLSESGPHQDSHDAHEDEPSAPSDEKQLVTAS